MALTTGLTYPKALGGVISMSGYLPRPNEFTPNDCNLGTPVLFCHGDDDDVVNIQWARDAANRIKETGLKSVEFKVYRGMPHSACRAEIDDVTEFVKSVFSRTELLIKCCKIPGLLPPATF